MKRTDEAKAPPEDGDEDFHVRHLADGTDLVRIPAIPIAIEEPARRASGNESRSERPNEP